MTETTVRIWKSKGRFTQQKHWLNVIWISNFFHRLRRWANMKTMSHVRWDEVEEVVDTEETDIPGDIWFLF